MPQVLKIGQLAQATGVSAKTIRYYEQVGVLPPANRTAAGYRLYAEQGLHRLLFVRRARTLGLSLQNLKSLTAALDDGPRATVRSRLLGLVREQLSAVQQQISDLHLFQQQLEQIVQRLSMPPPADHSARCRCLEIDDVPAHRDNGRGSAGETRAHNSRRARVASSGRSRLAN
jgi:MerR family transcriptional regulator, copper efflux regulator